MISFMDVREMIILVGDAGNDELYGNEGDDILTGGEGNDYLSGGYGKNRYVFGQSFGVDEIEAVYLYNDETFVDNTVEFIDGIRLSDLYFIKNEDDLIVKHINNQDQVTIKRFYTDTPQHISGVNQFTFSDGQMIDKNYSLLDSKQIRGTDNNDKLIGNAESELIDGKAGNDDLKGGDGDDILNGGQGNDHLYGELGNDTLVGGEDNDTLVGGYGHDRYVFSTNSGNDVVRTPKLFSVNEDNSVTLVFEDDIQLEDLNNIYLSLSSHTYSKSGQHYTEWYVRDLVFVAEKHNINITIADYALTKPYDDRDNRYAPPVSLEFNNGAEIWQVIPHKDFILSKAGGLEKQFSNSVYLMYFDEETQTNYIQGINRVEYLQGTDGKDVLDGKQHNDYLAGGFGVDHYVLSKITFDDVIVADNNNHEDAVLLKDITLEELYFLRDQDDLYIKAISHNYNRATLYQQGDQFYRSSIKLEGYFNDLSVDKIIDSQGNEYLISELITDETKFSRVEDNLNRIGSKKDDYIETYDGADVINAKGGNNQVEAGEGNNKITTANGDDLINTGSGNNEIKAGSGNNRIYTGNGNNLILSGAGDDVIKAGHGNNVIKAGSGKNTIQAGSGDNQIFGGSDYDFVYVNDGNNIIKLGNGDNELDTGDGDNIIYAGYGADLMDLGDGNNVIKAGHGENNISVGDGDNQIFGGKDVDYIYTGDGNNVIKAGHGNNEIYTGTGDNTITTGNGADYIEVQFGKNIIHSGAGDDVIEIEHSNGSSIYTATGNDQILINTGMSWIDAGDGDDVVYSGDGNDVIYSGKGNDNIDSGDGDDIIYGQSGNNVLNGNEGNDILYAGKDGHDQLLGGAGNDTLYAKNGNDHLYGNTGDDKLIADGDNNTLEGGEGSDYYQVDLRRSNNVIINNHDTDNSSDFLKLHGLKTDDIRFYREVSNLVIKNLANQNKLKQIVVENWFESEAHKIDEIEVGNHMLDKKRIDVIIQTLASFNVETGVGEDLLNKDQKDEIKSILVNSWIPKA